MLVLSRRKNQEIVIGDGQIKITIVEVRGDNVRVGIEAPKEISIHRREVYDAIEQGSSSTSSSELVKI